MLYQYVTIWNRNKPKPVLNAPRKQKVISYIYNEQTSLNQSQYFKATLKFFFFKPAINNFVI